MMESVNKVLNFIKYPIVQYLKWKRVEALSRVAEGAKNTKAGHRVYLRAVTMMEIELGVDNQDNYEVKEGYLDSVSDLIPNVRDNGEDPDETKVLFVESERENNV